MSIEYESKYQVGQKLYYLDGSKIKEAEIVGIKIAFQEGPYYKGDTPLKTLYKVNDGVSPTLTEEELERRFYISKQALVKYIVDQM